MRIVSATGPAGQNARELVQMVGGGLTSVEEPSPPRTPPRPSVWTTSARSGSVADLLVLDGDPLAEPEILLDPGRIRLVLQAGDPLTATPRQPSYNED